jgi:hypothetical protein
MPPQKLKAANPDSGTPPSCAPRTMVTHGPGALQVSSLADNWLRAAAEIAGSFFGVRGNGERSTTWPSRSSRTVVCRFSARQCYLRPTVDPSPLDRRLGRETVQAAKEDGWTMPQNPKRPGN